MELIQIVNRLIKQAKKDVKAYEGGMLEYIETLQDSDTFYNEVFTTAELYTLKKIKKIMKDLPCD